VDLLVDTVFEVVLYELVSTRIASHHVNTTLLADRALCSIAVGAVGVLLLFCFERAQVMMGTLT
jgi:hypothetical protein